MSTSLPLTAASDAAEKDRPANGPTETTGPAQSPDAGAGSGTQAPSAAAAPQPVERPLWLRLCFIFAGLSFFITQGLGMNLVMANIYQLQGEFSATVAEVAWLSAA